MKDKLVAKRGDRDCVAVERLIAAQQISLSDKPRTDVTVTKVNSRFMRLVDMRNLNAVTLAQRVTKDQKPPVYENNILKASRRRGLR